MYQMVELFNDVKKAPLTIINGAWFLSGISKSCCNTVNAVERGF